MDNIKYEGDFITKEIFSSQVCIDGRWAEYTEQERIALVKKIYKNTKRMLKYAVLIPLKLSHYDSDPLLKGSVQDIKLKKKKMTVEGKESEYYAIIAKMFLHKEFLELYNSGRIPGISVEIYEAGSLPDGTKFDDHIFAVSFNGTDSVALPWLDQQYTEQGQAYLFRRGIKNYNIKEVNFTMPDMEAVLSVLDEAKAQIEMLYQEADSTTEDEAPPAEMDSKESLEAKDELKRKKLDRLTKEFDSFAKQNRIPITHKDDFVRIAYTNNLDFAKRIYSSEISLPKPPTNMQLKSTKIDDDSKVVELKNKIAFMERNGHDKTSKDLYKKYKSDLREAENGSHNK